MSEDRQAPLAPPVTLGNMNARIEELERQRNQAQSRCAVLAGEKAEIVDLLRQSQVEIARLNDVINQVGSIPSGEPASPALN
ncbi:hypothetical protein G3T14_21785 [Methylobacterium sp. BTF04]|uniref:hypothetical protein n=1 Tax=Methylobacterium sp. BTF04 TaxID=2708300 RepID=UPI0013D384CA|nr:hypothetical protein [Methylobacterium sp. BTF04]NEU14714.1 hypothetical protein [Methylobacterium sp. BTF04]